MGSKEGDKTKKIRTYHPDPLGKINIGFIRPGYSENVNFDVSSLKECNILSSEKRVISYMARKH